MKNILVYTLYTMTVTAMLSAASQSGLSAGAATGASAKLDNVKHTFTSMVSTLNSSPFSFCGR